MSGLVMPVSADVHLINATDQLPGVPTSSMELKGTVSSSVELYKCWSRCSLLSESCWTLYEEQFLRSKKKRVLDTGEASKDRRWERVNVLLSTLLRICLIISLFFDFYSCSPLSCFSVIFQMIHLKVALKLFSYLSKKKSSGSLFDALLWICNPKQNVGDWHFILCRTQNPPCWTLILGLWLCIRKAGHRFPNRWNYHCFLCP